MSLITSSTAVAICYPTPVFPLPQIRCFSHLLANRFSAPSASLASSKLYNPLIHSKMGAAVEPPVFAHTPISQIAPTVTKLRATFFSGKTRPYEYRIRQLQKLYYAFTDASEELYESLRKDLNKSRQESMITEIGWTSNDILFTIRNLAEWMKDYTPAGIPFALAATKPRVRKEALGCCLVIGAFNFPVQLAMGPFIACIASGNTAVLKPSEQSPHTAAVLAKIIESSLDPSAYACIQGAIDETTALLDQKWDKVAYTGGIPVGKIIAKKMAETLTPVLLELGGINPAIVTSSANVDMAAKRLLWGKTLNGGQVCLCQNYIVVPEDQMTTFVDATKKYLKQFFPDGTKGSSDYSRIVNERAFDRIMGILKQTKGKVIIGGASDRSQLWIEPTLILLDDTDDILMREEVFGPLQAIIPVKSDEEALEIARKFSDNSLTLFAFGEKKETDKVLDSCRSGMCSINDGKL